MCSVWLGYSESSSTAIPSRTGGYQGIGFAIPVNTIKNILDDLLQYGEVQTVSDANDELNRTVSEALLLVWSRGRTLFPML